MDANASKQTSRRDILLITTGAVASVGAGLALWPFIDQASPDASITRPLEVDLSSILEGEEKIFAWRRVPALVRHRTPHEVALTSAVQAANFQDTLAQNPKVDAEKMATDENRAIGLNLQYLVVEAMCTQEGCIVTFFDRERQNIDEVWSCPCCGSVYDGCGRVLRGPAPTNLAIPPYKQVGRTRIQFAEDFSQQRD